MLYYHAIMRSLFFILLFSQLACANPRDLVRKYSELYGVDSLIVYAVIETESQWNPSAKNSGSGCLGLMQLNPPFHGKHPAAYYLNVENNIRIGVKYLKWLLDSFNGDVEKSLTGYCHGPYSRKAKAGASVYSDKVLKLFKAMDKRRDLWIGINVSAWNTRYITETDHK